MDAAAQLCGFLDKRDTRGAATFLVKSYMRDVFALCLAMVRNEAIAEELSQDVFSKAFSAIGSFRGESSPRTWVLKIARNRSIDYLRSMNREPWGRGDEPAETAVQEEPTVVDLMARREELQAGLALLNEGERALVMLRFGHGLAYTELAETFGLKEGAVRMRLSRAVGKMREQLTSPARVGRARSGARGSMPAPSLAAPVARRAPPPAPAAAAPSSGGGAPGGPAGASPFAAVPRRQLQGVLLQLANELG